MDRIKWRDGGCRVKVSGKTGGGASGRAGGHGEAAAAGARLRRRRRGGHQPRGRADPGRAVWPVRLQGRARRRGVRKAFADGAAAWRELHAIAPDALAAYLDAYLSETHLTDVGSGCILAACLSEVRRQDPAIGAAFTEGFVRDGRDYAAGVACSGRAGRGAPPRAQPCCRRWSAASPWPAPWRRPTRRWRGRSSPPRAPSWSSWRSANRGGGRAATSAGSRLRRTFPPSC